MATILGSLSPVLMQPLVPGAGPALVQQVSCHTFYNSLLACQNLNTVQCSEVQCSAVQCSIVQQSVVYCSTVQYRVVWASVKVQAWEV